MDCHSSSEDVSAIFEGGVDTSAQSEKSTQIETTDSEESTRTDIDSAQFESDDSDGSLESGHSDGEDSTESKNANAAVTILYNGNKYVIKVC